MKYDPFTLRVALDKKGAARGELYLDDGETFSHREGNIVWREFIAEKPTKASKSLRVSSRDLVNANSATAVDGVVLSGSNVNNGFAKSIEGVRVEKVVILGLSGQPSKVNVEGGKELEWEYVDGVPSDGKKEGTASILTVKNPGTSIISDWALVIQL